jgi:excisionase family DNA binding protein
MDRVYSNNELQLLTVKQTAMRLCCSPANVYSFIEDGELPVVRVGRQKGYRVDVRDLDVFVNDRRFRYRGTLAELPQPKFKHLRR